MRAIVLVLAVVVALGNAAHADEDDEMGRRVQALLRVHQSEVFGCVDRDEGEALLHVVVGDDHLPAKVEVLKADAGAKKAASCVADHARHWDLASLHAGTGDQLVFPLAFKPATADVNDGSVQARMKLVKLAAHTGIGGASGCADCDARSKQPVAFYVVTGTPMWRGTVRLAPRDVVYAPDGAYSLAADKHAATLVQIDVGLVKQGGVETIRHATDVAALPLPSAEVRLYLDGVVAPIAIDELCAKKGATIPTHTHDADELLYIVRGRGVTTLDNETVPTKAGAFITIPRGTPHGLRVDADVCAVQVYAPAGPEQRFKAKPRNP